MARGNQWTGKGEITTDIYFDFKKTSTGSTPFLRFYMFLHGNEDAMAVKGLRVVAFGTLAELCYGYLMGGSRVFVEGHIQIRDRMENGVPTGVREFEVVAEEIDFLRDVDWEKGEKTRLRLVAEGKMQPTRIDKQRGLAGADAAAPKPKKPTEEKH